MAPKISVLMPVLNGNMEHLSESINSILAQTFCDFEFIIVDDGSNKETKTFLSEQAKKDSRINIIINEQNIGVGASLNVGLSVAKGEYIARHDADDNAKPHRLETQIKFMETNPSIHISCSSVHHIDMNGNYVRDQLCSTNGNLIKAELLLNSRLCHPTLMIKTETLKSLGGYPLTKSAQDYLLYLNLLKHSKNFGGIADFLVDYRINNESITRKNRIEQLANAENGSYLHVTSLLGDINRQAFSRFWYFVALEGEKPLKLTDLYVLRSLIKLIKTDVCYKKSWLHILRWVSRKSFDAKPSLNSFFVAIFFRYFV